MIILSVDTTGPVAGVGLMEDGRVRYEAVAQVGLTHSETLMPMLEAMMAVVNRAPKDVDLYACVAGPGSFTGVRIGVCAVKALAQAHGKKAVSLNALEVLAAGQPGFAGLICPMLDARRDQVYAAAFRWEGGALMRVMPDQALSLADFFAALPGDAPMCFTGDGARAHVAEIAARFPGAFIAPECAAFIRPGAALMLAADGIERAVDAAELAPIYLRAPQAERERAQRLEREGGHV